MHFVVSWEITPTVTQYEEINNTLIEVFRGYSWLRLLPSFYILEADSQNEWNVIHQNLLTIAQKYEGEVNFLMSPLYDVDSEYFVYQMPDRGFYRNS
ncbi:MAG: hypothetical protein AB1552_06270 [Nitrospirota bacterium]